MTALIIESYNPPGWWTEEHADKAATMLSAAFAEAGYPTEVTPGGPCGVDAPSWPPTTPSEVALRARGLVFMRLGVEHEWCPACPDGLITREVHEARHRRAGLTNIEGGPNGLQIGT